MKRTSIHDEVAIARRLTHEQAAGTGEVALLCVGSYGANILVQLLQTHVRSGTENVVGAILLIEPDERVRKDCLRVVPKVFRNRIIVAELPNFPVGMSGASIGEVQAMREAWARHAVAAAGLWVETLKAYSENGVLVAIISPGGSAALAADAIELYRATWPWKKVYAATILDEKTAARMHAGEFLELYEPLVHGLIINDNRRMSRAADAALCLVLASTPAARMASDRPADLANVLAKVFDTQRFATVSTWASTLPVSWRGNLMRRTAVTNRVLVEEAAKSGVHAVVEDPHLQSLPLRVAAAGQTRLALAVMPVFAAHLRRCAQAVRDDIEPWRAYTDPDLIVEFASVAANVLRGGRAMPAYVVLLQSLAVSAAEIEAFATGQLAPDASYRPAPPPGLLNYRPLRIASVNGSTPSDGRRRRRATGAK